MNLSIVKIPDYVIKALCTTLIHSLWQGLLLAAVAGMIIICTRKSTPVRRYNLLIGALAFFTVAVGFTFVVQLQKETLNSAIVIKDVHPAISNTNTVNLNKIALPKATRTINEGQIYSFLNNHSYTIVMVWFLIVFARSLQLMTGLHGLHHLRSKQIFAVDEAWENRVKDLAEKLGIKQIVSIAESGIAKVPMVIGHLKPLILIPVGLMTALSTAEIEAILVHELAHIRRRDYLVNLLVSLMEIIFFFNPAVLWISSLIKTERENCCDDIAVAQTSSKVNYIRALVSCQEYQLNAPAYAMAVTGHKNHLMSRVKRMVSNNNQSLNVMEKSLLAVCLVTAGLLTTAFSNADKINKMVVTASKAVVHASKVIKNEIIPPVETVTPVKPVLTAIKPIVEVAPKIPAVEVDTVKDKIKLYQPEQVDEYTEVVIPAGNLTTHLIKQNGVLYQINILGKNLSSVQVNGKTIAPEQYRAYMPIIKAIMEKNAVAEIQPIQEITPIREPIRPIDPITPITVTTPIDLNINTNISQKQLDQSLAKLNTENQKLSTINKTKLAATQTKLANQQAYLNSRANYDADKLKSYKPYNAENYKADDTKKEESNRSKLTAALIEEGVIQKQDDLASFKLSDTEFIVNGKKVPDDVYQKFRKEFVKLPGNGKKGSWSWMYNYTSTTETTVK
jgi:bla regulator protein BlaR1